MKLSIPLLRLKFAPFNQMYGHEVEHDASARLIHEDEGETMEAFAKSHVHSEVELEEVKVVRFAKFITETVAKRRLPTSAEVIRPSVVIKVTQVAIQLAKTRFDSFYINQG